MALFVNDLNFNEDLSASELTTVKGGRSIANVFTHTFGRDANAFAGANAVARPDSGTTDAHTEVDALPGGWGVGISFAISVVSPDPEEFRARYFGSLGSHSFG
jgi:hypothetical protein